MKTPLFIEIHGDQAADDYAAQPNHCDWIQVENEDQTDDSNPSADIEGKT